VNFRVAISYNSIDGALSNLEEVSSLDFNKVMAQTEKAWNEDLKSIEFKGITPEIDTIFYTAMYHKSLAPQIYSDYGDKETRYALFSLWDTYRAANPLYHIIDPRAGSYVNSMIYFTRRDGHLPIWNMAGAETWTMSGVHSVTVMAEAALKEIDGVNPEEVLNEIKELENQPVIGMEYLRDNGYVNAEAGASVARGLEYCINADAVYKLAAKLGYDSLAEHYAQMSLTYKKYYDPQTRFMRGVTSNGEFTKDFNPVNTRSMDYMEGNAWQYLWLVPHDLNGLADLMGGKKPLIDKLDSLFTVSSDMGEDVAWDVTGLIGQYCHGNEPGQHIPYIYSYFGERDKSADWLRKICYDFYNTSPGGIVGNEDCGQMSAWYIFTALGFYPISPVDGKYYFGSPLLEEAVIHTANGTDFKIVAKNNSESNKYIKSITLNGKAYDKNYITYDDIIKGGELVFTMGK